MTDTRRAGIADALLRPAHPGRWRSRLSTGLTSTSTALAHAPENAAYGLMALAPLGPTFGPAAMALALLGAVVASSVASLLGGGQLVGGARASLSLLTAGLVAALLVRLDLQGADAAAPVLFLVAFGVACAGALQFLFGLLKLGTLVKFTPHPVRIGVTSGVGLLLMITALPVMIGHRFGAGWASMAEPPQTGAALVGVCALLVTWAATRVSTRIPPVLIGLFAAALLHAVLMRAGWASNSLGDLMGVPTLPEAWLTQMAEALPQADLSNRSVMVLVGSYAVTAAVLCSLDTLFAASIVDGRLRQRRDANRELRAQGLANVATALVGGGAASPSIPRSLALVVPHPEHRHIVLAYAGALLGLLLLAPQLLGYLPGSAVGGVLLLQGAQMISPTLWRTPAELWSDPAPRQPRSAYDQGHRLSLAANWAVAVTVALNAVALGLGPAVLIGALFAVLLFVRANMRDVVRREWSGETRRSLKMRPASQTDVLKQEGRRIALLELDGSLFFGTADGLRVRLEALAKTSDTAILDLHQINEIDVTAARILFEVAEEWSRGGKHLNFAEWDLHDARRRVIETVATPATVGVLRFFDNTDSALEDAEDRLLERMQAGSDAGRPLALADTMIGRNLNADELALLSAEMQTLHFARGQVLFRIGDPGDAMYISLKGDIGLRIPGSTRRLASFAPGVTIGEMAVLSHGSRSAEAVAESDVTALRLSVESFDRLMSERPALAAKVLNSISLHLADRVRMLTGDLARWVSRAAAGRTAATSSAERRRSGSAEETE